MTNLNGSVGSLKYLMNIESLFEDNKEQATMELEIKPTEENKAKTDEEIDFELKIRRRRVNTPVGRRGYRSVPRRDEREIPLGFREKDLGQWETIELGSWEKALRHVLRSIRLSVVKHNHRRKEVKAKMQNQVALLS